MQRVFTNIFAWFEGLIDPFQDHPVEKPPKNLIAFYWHFIRQVWPFFIALLFIGLIGALIEVSLFAFLGQIVDMVRNATSPAAFFRGAWQHAALDGLRRSDRTPRRLYDP